MANRRRSASEKVCIPSNSTGQFYKECSENNEWLKLEKFWSNEKQRCVDAQVTKSGSLEEHLLHDRFLKEPIQRKDTFEESVEIKILRGDDILDIPTSYVTGGFQPQELIVIGTYVDKNILPGFQYTVRKNLTDEYLFDGKPIHLETVGLGYGKRLTFQGDSLNENSNYFWSDSHQHGFGFTFRSLSRDDVFTILDTASTKRSIGKVIINNGAVSEDIELETIVKENGRIEKRIELNFSCDVILTDDSGHVFVEETNAKGEALLVREGASSRARVLHINMTSFVSEGCRLIPEE